VTDRQSHSPRIAVLVACFNRHRITLPNMAALIAALDASPCRFDVHLLDDASPDRTGELVKAAHPAVNVVVSEGDLFWNRGMLRIFTAARGHGPYDAYLMFNDDVTVDAAAVARAVALWSELNAASPATVIGATRAQGEPRTTYSGYRQTSRHRVLSLARVEPGDEPRSCDTFNANFVLVPAATMEALGGNDPFYWHSFGDIDLGLSIHRRGERLVVAPGWIGRCDDRAVGVPSRHGLLRRLRQGLTGREDPRQNAYLIWKHRAHAPGAALAIAGMLAKRLWVLASNAPHVMPDGPDAKVG
jgi:GT2 family glycosyltransferase